MGFTVQACIAFALGIKMGPCYLALKAVPDHAHWDVHQTRSIS